MPVKSALDAATDETLRASRALVGVAARSLAETESDITLPQYRALVLLASRGEHNVGALAEALGIHASSATRLCDRLLAKGFIVRATATQNRREVRVGVSGDGAALVRTVMHRRRREIKRIVGKLDRSAQASLALALEAFAIAADELPDDAWKLGWTA